MCTASQSGRRQDNSGLYQVNPQTQQQFDSLDPRYQRWTQEDLQRTDALQGINQQVSQAEQSFNQQRDAEIARLQPSTAPRSASTPTASSSFAPQKQRPGPDSTPSPQGFFGTVAKAQRLSSIPSQFNADEMRQDLIRQFAIDRVRSGVYNRPQMQAQASSTGASVVGGASSRRSGGTSGSSRGGKGVPSPGPIGVNLNIGN